MDSGLEIQVVQVSIPSYDILQLEEVDNEAVHLEEDIAEDTGEDTLYLKDAPDDVFTGKDVIESEDFSWRLERNEDSDDDDDDDDYDEDDDDDEANENNVQDFRPVSMTKPRREDTLISDSEDVDDLYVDSSGVVVASECGDGQEEDTELSEPIILTPRPYTSCRPHINAKPKKLPPGTVLRTSTGKLKKVKGKKKKRKPPQRWPKKVVESEKESEQLNKLEDSQSPTKKREPKKKANEAPKRGVSKSTAGVKRSKSPVSSHPSKRAKTEKSHKTDTPSTSRYEIPNVSSLTELVEHSHNRGWKCLICKKSHKTKILLYSHFKKVHKLDDIEILIRNKFDDLIENTNEQISCKLCEESFRNVEAVKIHLRKVHDSELSDLCSEPKSTKTPEELIASSKYGDDMKVVDGQLACGHCDRKYERINYLRVHITRAHKENSVAKFKKQNPDTSDSPQPTEICSKYAPYFQVIDGKVKCKFCEDKFFDNLNSARLHIKRTHMDELLKDPDSSVSSTPMKSREELVADSKYGDDIQIVEEKFVCGICQKTFDNINNVRVHVMRHRRSSVHSALTTSGTPPPKPTFNLSASKYGEYINEIEDGLACKFCGREYPDLNAMRRHITMHLSSNDPAGYRTKRRSIKERNQVFSMIIKTDTDFQCVVCGIKYEVHDSIRRHVLRAHVKKGITMEKMTRSVENENGENEEVSNFFEVVDEKFKCLICSAQMAVEDTLAVHLRYHFKKGKMDTEGLENRYTEVEGGLRCSTCKEVLKNQNMLRYHLKWHESHGTTKVRCPICHNLVRKHRLDFHQRDRHWDVLTSTRCNVCDKDIPIDEYEDHKQIHAKRKRYKRRKPLDWLQCDTCGKFLKSRKTMVVHLRNVHGSKSREHCPVCNRHVLTHYMRIHLALHHKKQIGEGVDSQTSYNYDVGEKGEDGKPMLFCDQCGRIFNSPGALGRHYSIAHIQNKIVKPRTGTRYECNKCTKTFSHKDSLEGHLNTHAGVKPYVCEICGMTFVGRSNLSQHLRRHSDHKPHKCTYCDKAFRHRGPLKRHMCLHTGERFYHCDVCYRGFIHKHHFESHSCDGRPRVRKMKSPRRIPPDEGGPDNNADMASQPPPMIYHPPDHEYIPNGSFNSLPNQNVFQPLQTSAIDLTGSSMYAGTYGQPYPPMLETGQPLQFQVADNMMKSHNSQYYGQPVEAPMQTPVHNSASSQAEQQMNKTGEDVFQQFMQTIQRVASRSRSPAPRMPEPSSWSGSSSPTSDLQPTTHDSKTPSTDERKIDKLVIKLPHSPTKSKRATESSQKTPGSDHDDDDNDDDDRFMDADDDDCDTPHFGGDNEDYDGDTDVDEADTKKKPQPIIEKKKKKGLPVDEQAAVECPICQKVCRGQRGLSSHINTHPEKKATESEKKCDVCDRTFTSRARCEEHKRSHSDEKTFACEHCDKAFRNPSTLREHLRVHTGDKPYQCEICDQRFPFYSGWKRHLKRVHGDHIEKKGEFVCETCGKDFSFRENLARHKKSHNPVRDFACHLCSFRAKTNQTLKKHIQSHSSERPFICQVCGSSFKYLPNLQRHETTHSSEKNFKCEICEMSFGNQESVVRHKKQVHFKTYTQCRYCDKQYSDSTTLKRHENRHLGIFEYPCTLCSKGFDKKTELVRHLHVHQFGRGSRMKEVAGVNIPCPGHSRSPLNLTSRGVAEDHMAARALEQSMPMDS